MKVDLSPWEVSELRTFTKARRAFLLILEGNPQHEVQRKENLRKIEILMEKLR